MIVERQTISHLNALEDSSKILEEQLSYSIRGYYATVSYTHLTLPTTPYV